MRQEFLGVLLSLFIKISTCAPPRVCPQGAYFPEPEDCRYFYQCDHGTPVKKMCGPGTVFNPHSWVCDWPGNVDCGDTRNKYLPEGCPDGLHFSNLDICPSPMYYQCERGVPTKKLCDNGEVFNTGSCQCDSYLHLNCLTMPSRCQMKATTSVTKKTKEVRSTTQMTPQSTTAKSEISTKGTSVSTTQAAKSTTAKSEISTIGTSVSTTQAAKSTTAKSEISTKGTSVSTTQAAKSTTAKSKISTKGTSVSTTQATKSTTYDYYVVPRRFYTIEEDEA